MRETVILLVFIMLLGSGCADPRERLLQVAIHEFDAGRITTLLKDRPKEAEMEIRLFAGEPGWMLSHSNTESVEFSRTGNLKCPFMANQTYFLINPRAPDTTVLVSKLWLWEDTWRMISLFSEKIPDKRPGMGQKIVSYNIWDEDSTPKELEAISK
jgi:hypothetical protein